MPQSPFSSVCFLRQSGAPAPGSWEWQPASVRAAPVPQDVEVVPVHPQAQTFSLAPSCGGESVDASVGVAWGGNVLGAVVPRMNLRRCLGASRRKRPVCGVQLCRVCSQ